MEYVVGMFESENAAERAVNRLRAMASTWRHINILPPAAWAGVFVNETESPGVLRALGAVVGGASGAGAAIAAGVVLPGVAGVAAICLAAGALLTAAGVIGGAHAGGAIEELLDYRVPIDDLYVCEDALRRGRVVIVIEATAGDEAACVRRTLTESGAESIDAAYAIHRSSAS